MPTDEDYDVRSELLETLMNKVADDYYPSSTMLDMIESLLTPHDVPAYVEALLERVREDEFPSIDLLKRVQALG